MKIPKYQSFLLILIVLLAAQCSKDTGEKDYRDAYPGAFNFTIRGHYYNFTDSVYFDTTIYYAGDIAKDEHCGGCVLLHYKADYRYEAALSPEGGLSKLPGGIMSFLTAHLKVRIKCHSDL